MKFSTHVMLFIIASNAIIGAAGAAGMWDAWGIEVTAGVSDSQLENVEGAFEKVTTGNLGASTLINIFLFTAESLQTGWQIVTALPSFLKNIGVPGFIAAIPNLLVVVLVGRDIFQVLTGRPI